LQESWGGDLSIEHRAFPLRPAPEAAVIFKGTYREAGWERCGRMSAPDGITFTPWPHGEMPNWSLPALEAAKCAATQGDEIFERAHLGLYEAFFTRSLNIGDPAVVAGIVAGTGADMPRFTADVASGLGREAVLSDYERAVTEHRVRSIPTVIVPETGRALAGLADYATYEAAVKEAAA
jgi:predicted DsbA family dithiol-disulfide isomerase